MAYTADSLATIRGVTKRYGDLTAVDDVSLEIVPGEIFALLGPNGAGKTTLIGCVTGLVAGFSGEIRIAGYDVVEDYRITRRLVGLVPQELNWDAFFSVRDVLEFQGSYFGERPSQEKIEDLLRSFALLEKADANTRWLSGGMKRRLMICKALMHDPVLLFLDEPTAGVDVELREELWDYVRQLRDRGTTIVLTTHYIEEAEKLADRVGIINRGRLLRVDSRERLMAEFGRRQIVFRLGDPVGDALGTRLHEIGASVIDPRTVELTYRETEARQGDGSTPLNRVLRALSEASVRVEAIEGGRSSLEEIFKELVHSDQRQDAARHEEEE